VRSFGQDLTGLSSFASIVARSITGLDDVGSAGDSGQWRGYHWSSPVQTLTRNGHDSKIDPLCLKLNAKTHLGHISCKRGSLDAKLERNNETHSNYLPPGYQLQWTRFEDSSLTVVVYPANKHCVPPASPQSLVNKQRQEARVGA
jgi:hypothetical protein